MLTGRTQYWWIPRAVVVLAGSFFLQILHTAAADSPRAPQATIVGVAGHVQFRPAGTDAWYAVSTNQILYAGDFLRTGERSRAMLLLRDRSVLPIRESSSIQLLAPQQNVIIELLRGFLSFFHRGEPGSIEVRGGGINASVRGTEFAFEVADEGAVKITLYDGEVDLADGSGNRLSLTSGDIAQAPPGRPPRKTGRVQAGDWSAVQWVLYYPAILDLSELGWTAPPDPALAEAWDRFTRGNLPAALSAYPEGRSPASPEEKVFLAALHLAAGAVETSERWLHQAKQGNAATPATAHLQLIEVIRSGPSERSLEQGGDHGSSNTESASSRSPGDNLEVSATASLAESYRLQAAGHLSEARDEVRRAIEVSPRFGFAWVRLAELEFSLGRSREAEQAVGHATALVPENPMLHVIRGFLLSARNRNREAEAAFDQAIALDAALGDAWLGRGLSRIRRGDLSGGREDLMVAAAGEPSRATFRGYLGKGLADSRLFIVPAETDRARHELDLARQVDAGDPTAWLYSALLNQQGNRVNEAVDDLERSMELNNNRAIYRSTHGLDQDRAVRGANLASVYHDAGMSTVALRTATRAVEDDYANSSAHQFLADSYNALRDPDQVNLRYETAWFSEYLVANLLAPIGAGRLSTTVAPNEYSRFFQRDGPGLAGRTDYWSNGDWQQTAAQYGTFGNFEYSLDVFYRKDNGQRINDDSEQLTLSAQFKQQVGLQDTVFLQAIYYDAEFGDVAPYYDRSRANPDLRATDRQEPQLLAGWHHSWGPGSDTLFLIARLDDTYTVTDPRYAQPVLFRNPDGSVFGSTTALTPLEYRSEFSAWSLEGQHIWSTEKHTVVGGMRFQTGSFDTQNELGATRALGLPVPEVSRKVEADLGRFSVYAYEHWQLADWLRLSGGLSYDWLEQPRNYRVPPIEDGETEQDRLSPKVGLTITPWNNASLRAAYTRSLGGVSFDQSFRLEPTQVAGFNQTFRTLIPESIAGSVAGQDFETWGVSFEQRFPTRTYLTLAFEQVGSEAQRAIGTRELTLGGMDLVSSSLQSLDFEERSVIASIHQLVGRDFSFGANYTFSRASLGTTMEGVAGATDEESDLHRLELQARLTHPSGFFSIAEAVWMHQQNDGYTPARPGDDFWHLNLFAGWRFGERNLEVAMGILNLTDQDYQLNPLNYYVEPYRDRTFTLSFRFDF